MTTHIIALIFMTCSCASDSSSVSESIVSNDSLRMENHLSGDTTKAEGKMTTCFPFEIGENAGQFTITVATERPELYPKYAAFFERFHFSGNGYCWEGHITQIMEKMNPDLLQHIKFDSEAGAFFAIADTKENQLKFVELLSPIFADLKKLEEFVKKADPSRIDD